MSADRIRLVFDLETSDPDDVLTLCFLATHPKVDLRAVTLFPGGQDQVGVVRHVLNLVGRGDIPVGAGTPKKDAPRVSEFHFRWLGTVPPSKPDGSAVEIMLDAIERGATDLLTGAALTNVFQAFNARRNGRFFVTWTCQGGFAGDNVVPAPNRLAKFAGRLTCPTFNLNGDREASKFLTQTPEIKFKRFVTKNVCHGVFYDPAMHERIPATHEGLRLLKEGMDVYFRRRPEGKALHDVIAGVLAICPEAATWVEGSLYHEKAEWGTNPFLSDPGFFVVDHPPSLITIALDVPMFEATLAGQ